MGSIPIDYPDGQGARMLAALGHQYGWNYELNKLDGETPVQFVKRHIAKDTLEVVAKVESAIAAEDSAKAARQDVINNVQIT